ncbi:MAG: hypothetical protein NTY38_18910, partial [Acidobacteria bacterium]|nr:hypothetical protein [Acidobacteriota bacterium]
MSSVISRRCACQLLAGSPALQAIGAPAPTSTGIEAWFPTPAHQLVFRNWDLVPLDRIASALGCDGRVVKALARSMSLPVQQLAPERWSRMRFSALRRNWDFVSFPQLTRLLEMSESEITRLLAEDAFYVSHLGPKPDCPPITAPRPGSIRPLPWFVPSAAGGA